jgi:hypothetical protein
MSTGWSGGSKPTNTSTIASPTQAAPTAGVKVTPNATGDVEISFWVSAATTMTFTFGPVTGAEYVLLASAAPQGEFFNKRIPAGWSYIITWISGGLSTVTTENV